MPRAGSNGNECRIDKYLGIEDWIMPAPRTWPARAGGTISLHYHQWIRELALGDFE